MKKKDSVDGNVITSLYSEMISYFVGEILNIAFVDPGYRKNVCEDM